MIDLTRLPFPPVLEQLSFDDMVAAFMDRFQQSWEEARALNPALPPYSIGTVAYDPIVILGQADTYLRLLDRQRVNDAVKALLAPKSTGADLDNLVARQGIERLVVVPGTGERPPVMETDAALLRRYLLSFDRPSAGSAGRYLFETWTAAPTLADARVNGRAVHGRIGDTDIVIAGTDGSAPTSDQVAAVRDAVLNPHVKPEAIGLAVIPAERVEYAIAQIIRVPTGPDAELVRAEVEARVRSVALARMKIGETLPRDLVAGAAYGTSVSEVVHVSPAADVAAHPYAIPVCTQIDVSVEVIG